jgi:hypothetical protein
MGDRITIVPQGTKVKVKGVYNMDDLYGEIQLWMTHMGYVWHEVEYKKTVKGGGLDELQIIWVGTKNVDDYVDFEIQIDLLAFVSGTEVALANGKKLKRHKCALEFRIGGYMRKNDGYYKKDWQKKLYEYLIRDRIRQQEGDIFGETTKLIDELRAFTLQYPH